MSKYLKQDEIDDLIVDEIANAIKEGKLVVFPTDTVYGIGTNAYDSEACERIYVVKERPMYKPLIVLISDILMLEDIVDYISPVEKKLIDNFWPGPLTIKFKKKENILPYVVTAGSGYVCVRLLNDGLVSKIIKKSGVPVVAPSANLSGSTTGVKIDNIVNELGGKVDYILDFGDIESDVTSTIVEVEDEKIIVIREGKITKEELENVSYLM